MASPAGRSRRTSPSPEPRARNGVRCPDNP
jgi:hypothetical protein